MTPNLKRFIEEANNVLSIDSIGSDRTMFYVVENYLNKTLQALTIQAEALELYADPIQYDAFDVVNGVEVLNISGDNGDKAREAQAKVEAIFGE